MNSLSDTELKALLAALVIAKRVAVGFPPLEQNRFYVETEHLWDKFASEAIARGLFALAEIFPESREIYPGTALEGDDTAEGVNDVLDFYAEEGFWQTFAFKLATAACNRVYGERFDELSREQKMAAHWEFRERAEELFKTEEGVLAVLNVEPLIKATD
jgi:hypothetical protein